MTETQDLFGTSVNTVLVLCSVAQSCLTLWDPMDCSLLGSSVHGVSPGGLLRPPPGNLLNPGVKTRSTSQENSLPTEPSGTPNCTGMGSLSLLQGSFLTQKSNWGFQYCRPILYQLSYQGSPMIVRCHQIKNRHHIWLLLVVTPDHQQQGW